MTGGPMRDNWDETLGALDEAVEIVKRAFLDRRSQESEKVRNLIDQSRDKDGELGPDAPHVPEVAVPKRPDGTDRYRGDPSDNRAKGQYGEDQTALYMNEHGYVRIDDTTKDPNATGIDGIYVDRDGNVVIVESKYNTSPLGWAKDADGNPVRQMTDRWLSGDFHNHTGSRITEAIRDEDLAEAVEDLYIFDRVDTVVAKIQPDGTVTVSVPNFRPDGRLDPKSPAEL